MQKQPNRAGINDDASPVFLWYNAHKEIMKGAGDHTPEQDYGKKKFRSKFIYYT